MDAHVLGRSDDDAFDFLKPDPGIQRGYYALAKTGGVKYPRSAVPRVCPLVSCSMEPVTLSFATCVISATHVWPS